jgi:hypothetical protein
VVGGALAYLAWQIPDMAGQFANAGAEVGRVRWVWVAVAVLSGVGSLAAYGELHRQLLLVGGVRMKVTTVQGINVAQNAVSATIPVVGGAGSLGYAISQLRRRGVGSTLAAWSVLLTSAVSTVALLVLCSLGLAWAGEIPVFIGIAGALVITLGTTSMWLLLTHPTVLRSGLHMLLRMGHRTPGVCGGCRRTWADRADSMAGRLSEQVASFRPSGGRWATLIGVAVASWVLDFLALAATAQATGARASWAALVVGFLVVQGTVALQILPGGAGLAETGLLGTLLAFGVGAAPAAVTVLIYRAISWLGLSLAGWGVYALQPHATPTHKHASVTTEPTPAAIARSAPIDPASAAAAWLPSRVEDRQRIQVVPPMAHFAIPDRDHRDEAVVVGPPGADGSPVNRVLEHDHRGFTIPMDGQVVGTV